MEVITRVIMVGAVIIAVAVGELTRGAKEMNIAMHLYIHTAVMSMSKY